jgi:Ubiquitin-activating enzyme E1 FCCH domain
MSQLLVVGPIDKGKKTDRLAFNIDNDSFPVLQNAYQWRGRVKRKRGTSFLCRLQRNFPSGSIGVSSGPTWTINTIYSVYGITPGPNEFPQIVPGSVIISIASSPPVIFQDNGDGTLTGGSKEGTIIDITQSPSCTVSSPAHGLTTGNMVTIADVQGMINPATGLSGVNGMTFSIVTVGANAFVLAGLNSSTFSAYISGGFWEIVSAGNTGTINYLTGVVVLTTTATPGSATTAFFSYYPGLPVLGLEDFFIPNFQFTQTVAFDQTYSYRILTAAPFSSYDVSYYWNPSTGTYPAYTAKGPPNSTWTSTTWNGQNYQQFFTCNYQGALFATNGVQTPFMPTQSGIGMQFAKSGQISYTSNTATTITVSITTGVGLPNPLTIGDFVFFNEWTGTNALTLNFLSGYVTSASDPNILGNPNVITVTFPNAQIGAGPYIPGIIQYLTNRSNPAVDCIRFYTGDPITATLNPVFTNDGGWVNFMPPLSFGNYSIASLPVLQYYLVGAKIIIPFKDRLLVFGPVIQASSGNPIFLEDTIIWSQNGTPYYTSSLSPTTDTTDPTLVTTAYQPILVPVNETATPNAWWEDFTGYGGFLQAGVSQAINTVSPNEDALIVGFNNLQARLFYSGNDLLPFALFVINSELGSSSTFSAITMDQGVLSRGDRAFVITSQTQCQRIDLEIPDQVFETNLFNNGTERICSARDFINEWCYFSYPSNVNNDTNFVFPNSTLQYNYRDQSWAIFLETYTAYGNFKKQTGFIWATVGNTYPTWSSWNDPWDAGESTALEPVIIAGNQDGFVLERGVGTGEGTSLFITAIVSQTITSPNHGLNQGDFVIISGALGMTDVNSKAALQVGIVTLNTFQVDTMYTGTYIGGGVITRIYNPFIQTKQFPPSWGLGRKTRIGVQQYLLTNSGGTSVPTPNNAQISLLIYLSTNAAFAYNDPINVVNSSLLYSTVLYTCPESTNLGLSPASINLNMPTATDQEQIWHRNSTSLIGDTVQLGFTMSPKQIAQADENNNLINAFSEIELHGFCIQLSPSMLLS